MPVKPLPISTRHCTSAMKSLLYVTSLLLCVAAAIASSPSPGLRPLSEVMEMLYFHIPASNVTHFVASDREVTPLPLACIPFALSYPGRCVQVWTKYLASTPPFRFKEVWTDPSQSVRAVVFCRVPPPPADCVLGRRRALPIAPLPV